MTYPGLRTLLPAVLLTAACSGEDDRPREHLADTELSISRLFAWGDSLYFVDGHVWYPEEGDSYAQVTRLPLAGGEPEVVYAGDGQGRLERVAVDETGVYLLDPCEADVPHEGTLPCSRLIHVPPGEAEGSVMLEDEFYDLALGSEVIVLARSDQAMSGSTASTGEIWLIDRSGGEPVVLLGGIRRLHDILLDEEAGLVYFTHADLSDALAWRVSVVPLAGGEPEDLGETVESLFAPPITAADDRYLYVGGEAYGHTDEETVDPALRWIYRVARDGSGVEAITPEREDGVGDFAVFEGTYYLTDIGTRDADWDPLADGEVLSIDDSGEVDQIAGDLEGPTALYVDATHVYWATASNGIWRAPR